MELLAKVLPTLATALSGPLAGVAAAFVAQKLGLEDKSVEAVQAAIQGAGPEQFVQLRQIDAELAKFFAEQGVKLEEIHAGDRASAREREAKTGDRWTPRLLAGVIVGGFLCMVWYVLSGQVQALKDPVAAGLIGTLIGYVSAKADQVVSYYFGSSASSAEKNILLSRR